MGKQKIVLKLTLGDERKRRKAFKTAVGMNGVTSATIEGEKMIVIGDGVDPITLTTMLRRSVGHVELLSVGSGDDKKSGGGMMYGGGMGYGGGKEGKEGKESGGGGGKGSSGPAPGYGQYPYPAYQQQYNAMPMPSYPAVYSYPAAAYPHQEQEPGCRIM